MEGQRYPVCAVRYPSTRSAGEARRAHDEADPVQCDASRHSFQIGGAREVIPVLRGQRYYRQVGEGADPLDIAGKCVH